MCQAEVTIQILIQRQKGVGGKPTIPFYIAQFDPMHCVSPKCVRSKA